jgi:hypothetical protein
MTKQRFIHIDHGIDNCEEYVDLSRVIFITVYSEWHKGGEVWEHHYCLTFDNGVEKTISLDDGGRDKLAIKLSK